MARWFTWLRASSKTSHAKRRNVARHICLAVEQLEERTVPAFFPSTTSNIHVFEDQLPGGQSAALIQFLATHTDGTEKQTLSQINAYRAINPNYTLLHYQLGTANSPFQYIINGQWTSDWTFVNSQESWFVHQTYTSEPQAAGDLASGRVGNSTPLDQADIANPAWQNYTIQQVLQNIAATGAQGWFADSFTFGIGGGGFDGTIPVRYQGTNAINAADWPGGVTWTQQLGNWVNVIESAFAQYNSANGTDLKFIPNLDARVTSWEPNWYDNASGVPTVDGAFLEGFGQWTDTYDWTLSMNRGLNLTTNGKIVIMQPYFTDTPDSATGQQERNFYLGTYLLLKGDQSYLNMMYGGGAQYFPEYQLNLGAATTPLQSDVSGYLWNGVYRRDFQNGFVLVNPGTTNYTLNLGGTYQLVQGHGGGTMDDSSLDASGNYIGGSLTYQNMSSITLAGGTAAIFMNPTGSAPSITTQPQSQTIFSGHTANLSVSATGTNLSYQWYLGTTGTTTNPISGATSNTLTTASLSNTTNYWVKVSNSAGSVNSNTATITVNPAPTISTQPQNQSIFSGQTVSLSVSANGASLGYQWYVGASGNTSNPVNGATASTFTSSALTSNTSYWVKVTNGAGSINSNAAIITVNPAPTITTQPLGQTIFSGQTASLSVIASGVSLTYQWYIGTSGITTNPINGATASSYSTQTLTNTTNYWVKVTNGAGSTNSNTATVTVNGAPVITNQPQNQSIASGQTATLSVTATGVSLSYQWYQGISGNTANPMNGATSSSFTTPPLTSNTSYWVKVTNGAGSTNSNTATVSVAQPPPVPTGLNITGTGLIVLTWSASSGATGYNVFRSTTPGGEGTIAYKNVTITKFVDTTAPSGVKYYYKITAVNAAGQSAATSEVSTSAMSLDVDANGVVDALTDGVLIIRYLFGFTGTTLTANALGAGAARTDPAAIVSYLASARSTMLDDDASGTADALTDGVLAMRYMFSFTGATLISNALAGTATRTSPVSIQQYLDSYNPTLGHLYAEDAGPGAAPADVLTPEMLRAATAAAIARWEASGITAAQDAALKGASVQSADLAGTGLGQTHANAVLIDIDAAGHGWFIDPTPLDDSEFPLRAGATELQASNGTTAAQGVDLLTVVMHELGLVMGLKDLDSSTIPYDLMSDVLGTGTRRLPDKQ